MSSSDKLELNSIPTYYNNKATTDLLLSVKTDKSTTYIKTEVNALIPSVENFFDGAEYDSNTKRINFKHNNVVKAYIDATSFIKDGMVENIVISGGNLVISFNTDSGKEAI